MIFTNEMIEEIRNRLIQLGIKDTQIRLIESSETLTGEDTFVIVKNGENIRIPLQKLYDEIAIIKSAEDRDIFNVSNHVMINDITGEHDGILTLAEAINATPEALRKVGQIITFKVANGKWKRYQMVGKTDDSWIENNFEDISKSIGSGHVPSNISYFDNDAGYTKEEDVIPIVRDVIASIKDSTINGDVNFSVDSETNKITATVYGLGTAAYTDSTDYANSTQGGYADSALQNITKGTDGNYFTTIIEEKTGEDGAKTQAISGSIQTQDIWTADEEHDGIATTLNVKDYIYKNNIDQMWYGVCWSKTDGNPDCIRIGNPNLHRTLPVQSQMIGGVLTDAGEFTAFDNQEDWTQATQLRDGSQGQVMVRIPRHYVKFTSDEHYNYVMMSAVGIDGFTEVPEQYVSAYEASLQRSTNKLSSVVNLDVDYRGGNNNADWDGTYMSLLGRPATKINISTFQNYARNRGTKWNALNYSACKALVWLFVCEYATLNIQKDYNAELRDGMRQGGLGLGVTNFSNWSSFNSRNPFVPCGVTDEFGNLSGIQNYNVYNANEEVVTTVSVPRYRGIENLYGHIWSLLNDTSVTVNSQGNKYIINGQYVGEINLDGKDYGELSGFVSQILFEKDGCFFPSKFGSPASSSSFFCDNIRTHHIKSTLYAVYPFGGTAGMMTNAGLFCTQSTSYWTINSAANEKGTRLTYLP